MIESIHNTYFQVTLLNNCALNVSFHPGFLCSCSAEAVSASFSALLCKVSLPLTTLPWFTQELCVITCSVTMHEGLHYTTVWQFVSVLTSLRIKALSVGLLTRWGTVTEVAFTTILPSSVEGFPLREDWRYEWMSSVFTVTLCCYIPACLKPMGHGKNQWWS